jgi:hypothetical protein
MQFLKEDNAKMINQNKNGNKIFDQELNFDNDMYNHKTFINKDFIEDVAQVIHLTTAIFLVYVGCLIEYSDSAN